MKSEITRRVDSAAFAKKRAWVSLLVSGLAVVCFALMAFTSVSAEAQVPERHYVFALDDSGSMGNPIYEKRIGANDPFRMSRFAVRALLEVLPDEVSATIITMSSNGIDTRHDSGRSRGTVLQEVDVPDLLPLGRNRARLNALLAAPAPGTGEPGAFTTHDNPNTPCQRVLDGLAAKLNEAYRPGAIQTAVFLSDGICTRPLADIPSFLDSLESEQAARRADEEKAEGPRPFQFYFICMGPEGCSKSFVELAEITGGASYTTGRAAKDPQPDELLSIFGQAIGRSLDLCPSEHVSTVRSEIASYPGASSTKLIAVPGRGESLEWDLSRVESAQVGEHHWDGEVFRFYSASLPAGHAPMRPPFGSKGLANRWSMLAIPYYREVRPVVRMLRGECDIHSGDRREGPHVIGPADSLPLGETVCVELVLEGDKGVVLRRGGLGREVNASLDVTHGAKTNHHVLQHAPDTTQERFLFQEPKIEEGAWTVAGQVELSAQCLGQMRVAATGGRNTIRRAHALSYVARGVNFGVDIEVADELLQLEPNMNVNSTLAWRGNFAPDSELQVWRGDEKPREGETNACVTVKYGEAVLGHGPSEAITLRTQSGATSVLSIEVGSDCGFSDDDRERSLPIHARLVSSGDASVTTLRYVLTNALHIDEEVHMVVTPGGGEGTLPWGPKIEAGGVRTFSVVLDKSAAQPRWPRDLQADILTVGEAREHARFRRKRDRVSELTFPASDQHVTQPLVLRVRARSCCDSGEYRVPARFTPHGTDGHPGRALTQVVIIEVTQGNWLACWLPRILLGIGILFLLFLLLMLYRLVKHTVLIDDKAKNALQSTALTLGAQGGALERDGSPKMLLDGRRWPLGHRFPRKLRLMREGFGHAVRRRDWFETYKYVFGNSLIVTPPTFVSGVGGIANFPTRDASGTSLPSGLYVCAESNGRPALWLVNPLGMGFVFAPVDEETAIVRELTRGRRKDEEDEDARAAVPLRVRRHILIDQSIRTSQRGDLVGFQIQG